MTVTHDDSTGLDRLAWHEHRERTNTSERRRRRHDSAGLRVSVTSVGIAAVFDAEDDDLAVLFVDPVQNPIGAAPRRVDIREFASERFSDSSWVVDQCSGEELDHCCGHGLWQTILDGSRCRWGEDQLEGLRHGRRARTASAPRMTLPSW